MHVTEIPFNKHLGVYSGSNGKLELAKSEALNNRLGTVHAMAKYDWFVTALD